MAVRSRRGSFGLKPRVVPDISGQIIALAREYVAKRDSLIMDAWRNGGTFDGKKATDDMVLAYWNEREKGLDPTDPDYEQAKDQVMQLQYGIAQSKADVLHTQNKMSDNQFAQFYLNWAKKVPANSEFYRTLQKDAAQLIESAKAKSKAAGEKAKTDAFNAFVKGTTTKDIAIGDAMTAALTALSKKTGLSITGNGDELLAMLTKDVGVNPADYRQLLDTIKAGDPHWNGQLTEGYFTQHLQAAAQGYSLIADRAQKAGYVSAYASATQGLTSMTEWGQNIHVWPVATTYSNLENSFLTVWNDPNASQMDKTAAAAAFSGQLTKLSNTPGIDPGSKSMIQADAARLLGQNGGDSPSFGASMLGRPGVDPTMTAQLGAWTATTAELHANPAAFAYAPVDASGQFDPTGKGALGIVPAGSIPPGTNGVMVPGADGKAVLAMIPSHAVYANDPNNPNASPTLIGHEMSYNVGGRTVQLWGYKDAQNNVHWSVTSPVNDGAATQTDNKGDVFITPHPVKLSDQIDSLPNAADLTDDQKKTLLAGGSIETLTDTSAKGKAGVRTTITISVNGGYISSTTKAEQIDATNNIVSSTTTPTQLTSAAKSTAPFSPSRLSAGDIAGVTFSSPLQASVVAASYTQTQDQVSKFASDPAFQQAFLNQTMQTLSTTNPLDPRIASAWQGITSPSAATSLARTPQNAGLRADLNYPGEFANPNANEGQLNINFGQVGELKLPGLPSYLGNSSANVSSAVNTLGAAYNGLSSILPGLGLPQIPGGSPAVTATPQPTVTPTAQPTHITPAPGNVTPQSFPAPTPAPTSITGGTKPPGPVRV